MTQPAYSVDVALVNMPFSYSKYPSIQLGTLSALLKSDGVGVRTHYLNLAFAQRIGLPLYELICEKRALFGEWLFSRLLFRENPKNAEYVSMFKPVFDALHRQTGHPIAYFEEIHDRLAPQFLTWAMTAYDWGQYRVVGFTSTFDQNVASLSLAKLIKDLYPEVRIVFGGANYDGEMGLEHLRAFPWIDYVVVGEGEHVFPPLVKQLVAGQGAIPRGVAHRDGSEVRFEPNTQLFTGFSTTGPPDYDDYYDQVRQFGLGMTQGLDRILLYEGSRGCWWGEKHHCTFCGLNAQAMEFRAKSSEQVATELDALSSRYDCSRFRFVDNIIDLTYIDGLFGRFAQDHLDLDVFIETKSNLGKPQIQQLAKGGVKSMQPGIESLSASQLKEMDKGVSPIQNLVCLKWSAYYNVHLSWNILLGFPGETNDDYRTQLSIIPSILHFQPPESIGKLWLERFSPYFKWPDRYGIRITGPGLAYEYVYDPARVDLNKIAYDFEYEIDWKVDPGIYEELMAAVQDWQRRHRTADKPFLYYAKAMSYTTIYDGRSSEPTRERFDGAAAFVIEYCNEAPRSSEQIHAAWDSHTQRPDAGKEITQAIELLLQKRIIYGERSKYFTLALPTNPNL
jgi:ribosomal peptide maturation radical SAM protein 1